MHVSTRKEKPTATPSIWHRILPRSTATLSWHIRGDLDVSAMREAAAYLVGEHDFAAFCAAGSEVKDTVRTIHAITLTEAEPFLHIEVTGSGFLYNMVRIIAGTLVDVGLGRIPPERVKEILDGKDRFAASATAPPQGADHGQGVL